MYTNTETPAKIIKEVSETLHNELRKKFHNFKGALIQYNLYDKGRYIKAPPANIVNFSEDKKYWYARAYDMNRNVLLFGTKSKRKEFEPGRPLLVIDFDKRKYFNEDCAAGIISSRNSETIFIKQEYFKLHFKKSEDKFKSLLSSLKVFDEQYIKLFTLENGKLSENSFNNLFKLLEECKTLGIKHSKEKSSNHLRNKFIDCIRKGYDKKQSMKECNIQEIQLINWYNQGKKGNPCCLLFYKACCELLDENFNPIYREKKTIAKSYIKCEICGKELSSNSKNKICKMCQKRKYSVKILLKLMKHLEPGEFFTKHDLDNLNLEKIEINDYIWTLQELDLIDEKNNSYCLKDRKELCNHIKKYGNGEECPNKSLLKTCEICGKTLPQNRLKKYCKSCEPRVKCAKYLNNILEHIESGSSFKKENLLKFYHSMDIVKGYIFKLQENNLIEFNENTEKYTLKNRKDCDEFLNKYLLEKGEIKPPVAYIKQPSQPEKNKIPKKTKKLYNFTDKKAEVFLRAISKGKSEDLAKSLIGISDSNFDKWVIEGKNGNEPFKTFFYQYDNILNRSRKVTPSFERLSPSKKNQKPKHDFTDTKSQYFLKHIKNGKSVEKACSLIGIKVETFNKWLKEGEKGIEPFKTFLNKYNLIIKFK